MMETQENQTCAAIVLGGGCFWCLEAVFQCLKGVVQVRSGYSGGQSSQPCYAEVCAGDKGHIEVVEIVFVPQQISLADLLAVFFAIHDPTSLDRQGSDVGIQYRSVIFYADDAQRHSAETLMRTLSQQGEYTKPLVTELRPLQTFWPAEHEHADYFARNPTSGYCQVVISPKVARFQQRFSHLLKD